MEFGQPKSRLMKRSTFLFFLAVVSAVVLIARYNSPSSRLAEERERSSSPVSSLIPSGAPSASAMPSASPTPTPQSTSTPAVDVAKAAAQIQPAVVAISVFEPSGKLLRTGTGVFVSPTGRVLTARSVVEGAAHAIVKSADNRIHNVSGILVDIASDDLAVLDTEIRDPVPIISPTADPEDAQGSKIAVVQSRLGRSKSAVLEGTITKKHKDAGGEWLELSAAVSADGMGAPVVNGHNEVLGLVTRGPADHPVVVRTSPALEAVLARTPTDRSKAKWFATDDTAPTPAEGPLKKVPMAQNPDGRKSKLIYSPPPPYPNSAGIVRGSGRFRLTFNANGQVKSIMILKSTENGTLDRAAIDTLRRWKSQPGAEWELNVPVTFQ
jgi:TonB family protein